MGKKNEYKFTMMFDKDDKQHQEVVGILNGQGRKVARFVARAVIAYKYGNPDFSHTMNFCKDVLGGKEASGKPTNVVMEEETEDKYKMDRDERELLKNTAALFRKRL